MVWRAAGLCTLMTVIQQAPAQAAPLPRQTAKAQQAGEMTAKASLKQVSLLLGQRLGVAWQQRMMAASSVSNDVQAWVTDVEYCLHTHFGNPCSLPGELEFPPTWTWSLAVFGAAL